MKAAYRFGVNYSDLAHHLSALPTSATAADLLACLEGYSGCDPEVGSRLQEAVAHLPPDAEWLVGAMRLVDVLKADNPRIVPGMLLEWMVERY